MQLVADLGINWWLDDFGTGYSSISHLRDLPIQGVKLDQSFTVGLVTVDSHLARLTRGLAGLARGLDLRTVAEGVETAEQAAMLRGQGWEMAQGWHFGKPAPLPE
jgi:EAL domain-containing protein (putative c-di-GMP-specific phosphodiesterase class I)